MPVCCVPGCQSGSPAYSFEHVRMFSLPKKGTQLRKTWLEQISRAGIGKADFNPISTARVCIKHFSHDAFVKNNVDKQNRPRKLATLRDKAMPTLFLSGPPTQVSNKKREAGAHLKHDHGYPEVCDIPTKKPKLAPVKRSMPSASADATACARKNQPPPIEAMMDVDFIDDMGLGSNECVVDGK